MIHADDIVAVVLETLALRLEETVVYAEKSISNVVVNPVRKAKESYWWVRTPFERMRLWKLLAVRIGKKIFARKGEKDEPTGQIHLVTRPEPPAPIFLFQGQVVVIWPPVSRGK